MSSASRNGDFERDDSHCLGRSGESEARRLYSSERYYQDSRYSNKAKSQRQLPPGDRDLGDGPRIPPLVARNIYRNVQRSPRELPSTSWEADEGYQRHRIYQRDIGEVNGGFECFSNNLEQGARWSPKSYQERKEGSHLDTGNEYNYEHSPESMNQWNSMSQYNRSEMGPRRDHIPLPGPTRRGSPPRHSDKRNQDTRVPLEDFEHGYRTYQDLVDHNSQLFPRASRVLDARERREVTQRQPPPPQDSRCWDDTDARERREVTQRQPPPPQDSRCWDDTDARERREVTQRQPPPPQDSRCWDDTDARERREVTQRQPPPPQDSRCWDDTDARATGFEALNPLAGLLPSQRDRITGTLRFRGGARQSQADPGHTGHSHEEQHRSEWEIVEALYSMREQPWPMVRRRKTRQELQKELDKQEKRWYSGRPVATAVRRGATSLTNLLQATDPLRRVLKRIEGKFGTSVVAVFNLLRSMMQLNLMLALLLLGAVVVRSATWSKSLSDQDYAWQALEDTSGRTNNLCSNLTLKNSTMARECNRNYTDYIDEEVINHKHNAADLVQDFLQGTGFLEWTLLFAGFYPAYVDGSDYNISLAYILTVLAVYLVSLVYVVYFAAKFLRQFLASSSKHASTYSNTIFAGWDFTVSESGSAQIQHSLFVCDVKAAFDDDKYMKKQLNRTRKDRVTLYLARVLINLAVFALTGGSWTGIYFLMENSQKSVNSSKEDIYQEFMWQYSPTAIVAVLNILYPLIFKFMVKFEHYRGRTELLITLGRCALIRLMSLSILIITKLTLIFQHSDICDPTVNKYICWETHLGQQVYSVLVLDLLIQIGITFVVNVARCALGRIDNVMCKRVSKIEFDVPGHVLDIVYTQAICWLGVQHVPLMAAFCFIYFCILFVLKLFTVQCTCVSPTRVYRASRSSNIFMTVLSFAFLVCIIPNGLAMLSLTPSKACSPFRGLNFKWQSLTYYICRIDHSASWIRWVLWTVDDAWVGVTLLAVLSLLLIYYVTVNKARCALIKRLEKKLRLTAKDKAYLVQDYKRAGEAQASG